jgi:hypothetical protein
MSFNAETYRVMITCSSDLGEQRQAVIDAIGAWNIHQAAAAGVVLLPMWETHSTRPAGERQQEKINQQLVASVRPEMASFSRRRPARSSVTPDDTRAQADFSIDHAWH